MGCCKGSLWVIWLRILRNTKKAHVWASTITSRKNIKEDTSKYECVNSSKICDNFESAVHEGLTLLAQKNGFKIQQQDVILKGKAPKSDYKITVNFGLPIFFKIRL